MSLETAASGVALFITLLTFVVYMVTSGSMRKDVDRLLSESDTKKWATRENQKWFSTKDKMPNDYMQVLIYAHGGMFGAFITIAEHEPDGMYTKAHWSGEEGFDYEEEKVSHWKYLPNPPVEEPWSTKF